MERLRRIFKLVGNMNATTYLLGVAGLILQLYIFIKMIIYTTGPEIETYQKEIYQIITMTSINIAATVLLLIGNFRKTPFLLLPSIILHITYFFVEIVISLTYLFSSDKPFAYQEALLEYGILAAAYVITVISTFVFTRRYIQLDAYKYSSNERPGYEQTI